MKQFKPIVTVALCVAMTAALLTACKVTKGGETAATDPVTLSEGLVTQMPLYTAAPTQAKTTVAITDTAGETVLQLPDENNGITVIAKTSPVNSGDTATVTVMATPQAALTLTVEGNKTVYTATASPEGIASFQIEINGSLTPGMHAVTIQEAESDHSALTHIEIR